MNRSYKILQDIYYSLHATESFDDDIESLGYAVDFDDIAGYCQRQWFEYDAPLTFPSKTINVAVIYARLLEHHFGQTAIDYLRDPDLLHGNDRFYQPYGQEYDGYYDFMLSLLTYRNIIESDNPSVLKTVAYFNKEFMIGSCEYMLMMKK